MFAPSTASEDQVRNAYAEFQSTYAEGGLPAVRRSADLCAGSVGDQPRVLDYCLAFSLFAEALQPQARDVAPAERLALARAALPANVDPARRVDEVRSLVRVVTGGPGSEPRPASAPPRRVRAKAPPKPSRAVSARAASATRAASASRAAAACRLKPTPTARAVCASPALRRADARMRAAYNQALAAGANRRSLARDQAEWQVAATSASSDRRKLAALYDSRTRELKRLAGRH